MQAEFDWNGGSVMVHQAVSALSGFCSLLALMLTLMDEFSHLA